MLSAYHDDVRGTSAVGDAMLQQKKKKSIVIIIIFNYMTKTRYPRNNLKKKNLIWFQNMVG